jgi:hypothetical protein
MKFSRLFSGVLLAAAMVLATGCTRIETGEVGVRIDASKQVQGSELLPGSFNQTIVGDVLTFPVKDIQVTLEDKAPLTSDNAPLGDFDVTVVYNVNPASVAELWTTKSKGFHGFDDKDNEYLLMQTYMQTIINNASYKVVRQYPSLQVADKRAEMELQIKEAVAAQLKDEKLDTSLTLSVVQIRSIKPNQTILNSAIAAIQKENELKAKSTEVEIAKKEAERMEALSANSKESIDYMNAQATLNISQAILAGRVNTIIVPSNMTSLMINGK